LNVEDFSGMPALETLELAKNHLKALPGDIFTSCPNLTLLNVSESPLESMPEEISGLAELNVLFWAHTKTTTLPATFSNLSNLQRVNLDGNQFDDETMALCSKMQAEVEGRDGFFKHSGS